MQQHIWQFYQKKMELAIETEYSGRGTMAEQNCSWYSHQSAPPAHEP